ncbi:helix-turn-helix domain-containing protein [Amnibacterium endophyticum]|uniref:Helix-turn-helix domain-containing protein n=1 Tax=Amnibacterium endophyticum TaxID=2109337 RepID=A0ABW4LCF7_9MICO
MGDPEDRGAGVGQRLQAARQDAGLSLSEVARRAGVGKGSLSELERGLRPARLETLWALSTALGVPLGRLVGDDPEPARGAAVHARLIDRWRSDALFELYRGTVGRRLQRSPAHGPGVVEVLTVLAGRLEAGPEGSPAVAATGGSLTFDGSLPHTYRALETPCEVLIVIRYGPPPQA